jgi:hypothetical protein
MVCLLVGGGIFTLPFAQPAAAATDGYSISNGEGPNHRPSMAISPDSSRVCNVWTTFNNSPNQTYVRIYSTATGAWSPDLSQSAFNVSRNGDGSAQGNTARCAIDGAGRTHVVWVEYPDGRVRYSMLAAGADAANGNNWTSPIDVTSAAGEGDGQNPDIVSIFADANGSVWLAYWSLNNNGVFVRNWVNGSGWSGATKVSSSGGKHPRIGADNQGYVHVIYQQSGAGMRYSYRDASNGQWSIDNAVPGAGGLIEQSGIAVDRDGGDVHIVLTVQLGGDDNTRVVRYIKKSGRTGLNFNSQQDITGQGNHVVARIAWSPSGKLTMVADKRNERAVTIATSDNNGASWNGASNLTSGNASQAWPSVAMDAAGNSYITYWTGENINFVQLGNKPIVGGTPSPSPSPTPPPAPPQFTSVPGTTSNSLTSQTISWNTSTPTTSRVFFSESPDVNLNCASADCTDGDPALVTSAFVTLRDLKPGTQYYYRARSTDQSGQQILSDTGTFTTARLEIVGTQNSYNGIFAAQVAAPIGTNKIEWSANNFATAGTTIFSGSATTTSQTVFAFSGDVTPQGETGAQTFTIKVRFNDGRVPTGPLSDQPTASISYNQASRPLFSDVDPNSTSGFAQAIYELAGRGIVRGSEGQFRPTSTIVRAEAAAIITRAFGWEDEYGVGIFPDQGTIDKNLWDDVETLNEYGIARGFADGTYCPTCEVTQGQMISLVTRAMVQKGYWSYVTQDNGTYPEVQTSAGDRRDLLTYAANVPELGEFFSGSNYTAAAERRFVARVVWEVVQDMESQASAAALYELP